MLKDHAALSVATLTNMREAIILVSADGTITDVNPAFQKLFEIDAGDLVGRSFLDAMPDRREFAEFNEVIHEAIGAPDEPLDRDIAVGKGDQKLHFSLKTSLLRNGSGDDRIGFVGVITNETERVHLLRNQTEIGRLLIATVCSLAVGLIATSAIFENIDVATLSGSTSAIWMAVSWVYLLLIATPALVFIYFSDMPLRTFGVTFDNWRQATAEAIAVAIVVFGMLATIKYYTFGVSGTESFVDWQQILTISVASYFLHSCLQELVIRGILQNSARQLLSTQPAYVSILVVALIFSSLHSAWGLAVIIFTFLSSFLFGWMMERHGTLVGVSLLHFLVGTFLFMLDLD